MLLVKTVAIDVPYRVTSDSVLPWGVLKMRFVTISKVGTFFESASGKYLASSSAVIFQMVALLEIG